MDMGAQSALAPQVQPTAEVEQAHPDYGYDQRPAAIAFGHYVVVGGEAARVHGAQRRPALAVSALRNLQRTTCAACQLTGGGAHGSISLYEREFRSGYCFR